MIDEILFHPKHLGYFAGTADGLTYVNNVANSCEIVALDAETVQFVAKIISRKDGHYLMPYLDPNKRYLLFARDLGKNYEPYAYDHAKPATDLSLIEQAELIALWQN